MTLDELLTEIERSPHDARLLRALGGALGVEMTKRRLDKLSLALRALARVARTGAGTSYEAGYAAAATDVLASFQAVLAAESEDTEMVALARNTTYAEVLAALANGFQTPTAIAAQLGKDKSNASRALAALREAGLVTAFAAPDGNERVRPHQLTPRGERIVAELRQSNRRRTKTPMRGTKIASAMTRVAPPAARKLKY
ncbi:MAG TPA: helix-turn-helix domain-containing protein [Kofleriaceae bacterium]|nr:helix-turn-helix domain-containing protein [Kofleriaceae bacterium]